MSQWTSPAVAMPEEGTSVWVRLFMSVAPPFLARWNGELQMFIVDDTGLTLPWWMVQKWKPQ